MANYEDDFSFIAYFRKLAREQEEQEIASEENLDQRWGELEYLFAQPTIRTIDCNVRRRDRGLL